MKIVVKYIMCGVCGMYFLVTYDVHSDFTHYRTSIARILLDYGLFRIQYSVFLGKLQKNQTKEIMTKINAVVKKECPIDIRFFKVCESCIKKSYIISRDRKTVGFVVSSMIEAIKAYVSYLKDKKKRSDIDKRGWIEVYEREQSYEEWKEEQEGKDSKNKSRKNSKSKKSESAKIKSAKSESAKSKSKKSKNRDKTFKNNNHDADNEEFCLDREDDEDFIEDPDFLKEMPDDDLQELIGIPDLDELFEAVNDYYLNIDKDSSQKEINPEKELNNTEKVKTQEKTENGKNVENVEIKEISENVEIKKISENVEDIEEISENLDDRCEKKKKNKIEKEVEENDADKLHYTISDNVFFF